MAIIDYNGVRTFSDSLQIDDIGNCAIRCEGYYKDGKTTLPCEYYMVTRTIMGKTGVFKFGPVDPEVYGQQMLNSFSASYKKIPYKEATIEREISMFINDGLKQVTLAEVILPEEAFEAYPSIEETYMNL